MSGGFKRRLCFILLFYLCYDVMLCYVIFVSEARHTSVTSAPLSHLPGIAWLCWLRSGVRKGGRWDRLSQGGKGAGCFRTNCPWPSAGSLTA